MAGEALRMAVYLGERDRAGSGLLCDALLELLERRGVRTAVLLRGIEGFGIKHRLASELLLTLSEDLPLLLLAVDEQARIESLLEEARTLTRNGLVTLERARLVSAGEAVAGEQAGADGLKLTVYLGRGDRLGGRVGFVEVVGCLHRHGVAGASVLLGLDGLVGGERRRARFVARNAQVPVMVQSVGGRSELAAALAELETLMPIAAAAGAITLERVRVCKRDGELLAQPLEVPVADASGLAYWQKLVVYTSERCRHGGEPVHSALVRRLRREGAAGATALRGIWGYHGAHDPHGEAFWSLARSVPVLTVLIDTPANMSRWFGIVDELTANAGLVTSELVPALHSAGPGIEHGGLALAAPHDPR